METLYEYLRGEHAELRKTVRRVDELMGRAWPTLLNCRVANSWPYELRQGKPLPLALPNYSSSTSSMILFSMGLGLGFVNRSPLAPGLRGGSATETIPGRDLHGEAFRDALTRLITNGALPAADPNVFSSGSFGLDDPFTLTWCCELLRTIHFSHRPDHIAIRAIPAYEPFLTRVLDRSREKVHQAISNPLSSCLAFPPDAERISLNHPFPLIRALHLARSMALILDAVTPVGGVAPAFPGAALASCEQARLTMETHRSQVYDHLLDCIHQQLSYHTMPNAQFDAAELAFAMEGVLLCSIPSGTADEELLHQVFKVIEERQHINPYWRPLKPFVTTQQGFALLPLSVEIASCLVRVCTLLGQKREPRTFFSRYFRLFTRYTEWLESRVDQGRTSAPAGGDLGQHFVGWHSEHVYVPQTVHIWETSQVLIYLLQFRTMLQKHIADAALAAAHLEAIPPTCSDKSSLEYWNKEAQCSEPLLGCPSGSDYRIYERLSNDFIALWSSAATTHKHCSALLYGPPGTGKTRLAKEFATALKWPLVIVTPSDFVSLGEAEVEMRAKSIFAVLNEQSGIVVLFDEIDRLILDRDSNLYREQGDMFQFMTPGMLTKIHDLRDLEQVIFLINTNYADRIDPAAKRAGRIDSKLLVTPYDLRQRVTVLKAIVQRQFGIDLPDDMVLPAAKASCFAIYKELEDVVIRAKRLFPGPAMPTHPQIRDALVEKAKDPSPGLRLTSYESRFRQSTKENAVEADQKFPSAQEPFEEFFVLVYLKCNANEPIAGVPNPAPDPATVFDVTEQATINRVAHRLLHNAQVIQVEGNVPAGLQAMRAALSPFLRDTHILEVLQRWRYGL